MFILKKKRCKTVKFSKSTINCADKSVYLKTKRILTRVCEVQERKTSPKSLLKCHFRLRELQKEDPKGQKN